MAIELEKRAQEYLRLWEDNPLEPDEVAKLDSAAAAIEVLIHDVMMEDTVLLNALVLINYLRGVEDDV